eukprot:Gb_24089 [translate_table: standard]
MATLAGSPTTSILRSSPFVFRGSVKHISHVHNNIKAFGRSNRSRLSASTASDNGAIPRQVNASLREDIPECNVEQYKMSLESLFCYDKAVPEEIIEKPIGLSLSERMIGNNPRCTHCQAKGVVLCATCTGSGLYVDSILESQGIIVKVRCLDYPPIGRDFNALVIRELEGYEFMLGWKTVRDLEKTVPTEELMKEQCCSLDDILVVPKPQRVLPQANAKETNDPPNEFVLC